MALFWEVQSVLVLPVLFLWMWQIESVNGREGHPLGRLDHLADVAEVFGEKPFWVAYLIVCAAIALLQVLLLLPIRRPRPRNQKGVPLAISAAVAGLMVAALVAGVCLAGYTTVDELRRSSTHPVFTPEDDSSGGAASGSTTPPVAPAPPRMSRDTIVAIAMGATVLLSWGISTPLVWAFCSRRLARGEGWELTLRALAAKLFVGTVVEMVAVIPMDVMIRRRTDCYCASGTLMGLSVGLAAGFVVLGPIVCLPLIAQRRRRWWSGRCEACGYDMTALLSAARAPDRCPECGCGWKP